MNDDQKKERGRPRKTASDRDADRGALVAAAFDIVREGGGGALTARSVASRAGVSVGSVYAGFPDLDALRFAVSGVTMGLMKDRLAEALSGCAEAGLEARLLCLAEAYIAFAERHRPIWSALFEARAAPAPPAATAHITELLALLEGVLMEGSGLAAGEARPLARALWSSVHGSVFLAEAGGLGPIGRDEVPALVAALIGAVVAGLERRDG